MSLAAVVDEKEDREHAYISWPKLEKPFVNVCIFPLLTSLPLDFGIFEWALHKGTCRRASYTTCNDAVLNSRRARYRPRQTLILIALRINHFINGKLEGSKQDRATERWRPSTVKTFGTICFHNTLNCLHVAGIPLCSGHVGSLCLHFGFDCVEWVPNYNTCCSKQCAREQCQSTLMVPTKSFFVVEH